MTTLTAEHSPEPAPDTLLPAPDPGQWTAFLRRGGRLWGVLLLASGIICFFAWNWAGMPVFVKLGLLSLLIVLCTVPGLWRGPDSLAGGAGLLLAGLLMGPLLAVYGQAFPSGAMMWELYRVWALALLPLALAGRRVALWWLVWLTASAALGMWLITTNSFRYGLPGEYWLFPLCQWTGMAVLEGLARMRPALTARVVPFSRVMGSAGLVPATCLVFSLIMSSFFGRDDGAFLLAGPALYFLVILGGWFWFCNVRHDLFLLSLGLFSLAGLFFFWLLFNLDGISEGTLLLMGLLLAALTGGCAMIIRSWQAAFAAGPVAPIAAPDDTPDMPAAPAAPKMPRESRGTKQGGDSSPWYVQAMLGLGGWLASLFISASLGSLLLAGNGIQDFVLIPLGFITFCIGRAMYEGGIFRRQMALAFAMTGMALVLAMIVFQFSGIWRWPVMTLLLALAVPAFPSPVFRFLAALGAMLVGGWGYTYLLGNWGFSLTLWWLMAGLRMLIVAGVAWLWLRPVDFAHWPRHLLPPLRWAGLVFIMICVIWGGAWLSGPGLLLAVFLLGREAHLRSLPLCLILALALAASWLSWHFFYLALCPVLLCWLLCFRTGSRLGLVLSSLFFAGDLVFFYYTLDITLLMKSALLAGIGLFLLAGCLLANLRSGHDESRPLSGPAFSRRRAWAALACAVLFLGLVTGSALRDDAQLNNGRRVILELAPVDPRAFLLGDYMDLRWRIEDDAENMLDAEPLPATGRIIVKVDENGLGGPLRRDNGQPLAADEVPLRYRVNGYNIRILPSALFFQEGEGEKLENAIYGDVRISESGRPLLKGLLDEDFQPLP